MPTIRTTEAIGLHQLHVIEPGNRFSIAGGVTRGSHKWIDLVRWKDPLAAVKARSALPALVKLLDRQDPELKKAVEEAIAKIGG